MLRTRKKFVVFLTEENIEQVLVGQTWLYTARSLQSRYLASVEAELLGPDAPDLLGLSQETTCYVTATCFGEHAPHRGLRHPRRRSGAP